MIALIPLPVLSDLVYTLSLYMRRLTQMDEC